jgi:hypothetical protein
MIRRTGTPSTSGHEDPLPNRRERRVVEQRDARHDSRVRDTTRGAHLELDDDVALDPRSRRDLGVERVHVLHLRRLAHGAAHVHDPRLGLRLGQGLDDPADDSTRHASFHSTGLPSWCADVGRLSMLRPLTVFTAAITAALFPIPTVGQDVRGRWRGPHLAPVCNCCVFRVHQS